MNQQRDIITVNPVQAESADNSLAEYISICWRHVWLIAGVAGGFAVVVAAWSFLQTPVYEGKATIVIEQEGPRTLEKDKYYPSDNSPEYFQTHFELMKSHEVLQRAANVLHLSERPEYQATASGIKSKISTVVPAISELSKNKTSDVSGEDQLLKNFSDHINIQPIRGARLAHITVKSDDPKFAALAANTLASVYIERTAELSTDSKKKSAQWFSGHLEELRNKVEASQQALSVFRQKHGLLEGQQRQAVTSQSLAELNSELVKAEMRKADAKTRYQQIESVLHGRPDSRTINWTNLDASTEVLNSPLIQILRAQEIKASGQAAELADKYGPLHPKMARTKAELQDLHERIQQEVQKIYDSVKREYDMAVARERAIQQAVTRYREDKGKVGQKEIEHGILEREAQSNQHMYDIFLKVAKEADLSSGMRASNVYLADHAVPSSIPVKPKKTLNIMLGLLVGLVTGFAGAFILEGRDRSLKGPDDVERYLPHVSLLGVVPRFRQNDASSKALVLSTHYALGAAAESFRTIRTGLLLSRPDQLPSRVLITSPGESEGKTTLAVNLATAMAQLEDTRVILIDADLRHPQPHPIFAVQTSNGRPKGLVDFLSGRADLREIMHLTSTGNLWVIPRGECPRNPSELLSSKHMSRLLTWLREEGFHVMVDAPPILLVADPAILAPQVDGVLLVASSGKTTREACRSAIQRVTAAGGKFLGVVLQKAPVADFPYYVRHY